MAPSTWTWVQNLGQLISVGAIVLLYTTPASAAATSFRWGSLRAGQGATDALHENRFERNNHQLKYKNNGSNKNNNRDFVKQNAKPGETVAVVDDGGGRLAGFNGEEFNNGRRLISTRDPQCTWPTGDPCTLNTTAIGMVEQGTATYYDEECAQAGWDGCYTQSVTECRTCYLSVELYMKKTNVTEAGSPDWAECPCCVVSTLESSHPDLEVRTFNFSVFNYSTNDCTDAPTQAPTPGPTLVPVPTQSPTKALTAAPATTAPTHAPTLSPAASVLPDSDSSPTETSSTVDTGDDSMSTTTKVFIGVGVAAGVFILGLASFGALKASGRA